MAFEGAVCEGADAAPCCAERGKNILYERQVAHLHEVHRKNVNNASSHLVKLGFATAPKSVPNVSRPHAHTHLVAGHSSDWCGLQVVRANLKKRMKDDERLAAIETENARLLATMAKIYEAPDTRTRLKKPPVRAFPPFLRWAGR